MRWFAWHPVLTDKGFVWLSFVNRIVVYDYLGWHIGSVRRVVYKKLRAK